MTEEVLPSGGLPWSVAIPAFGVLGTAVAALWKWSAGRVTEARKDLHDCHTRAVASREALRLELSQKIDALEREKDALEREYRDHLDEDLRRLGSRETAPTLQGKKTLHKTLSQRIGPEVLAEALRLIEDRTP